MPGILKAARVLLFIIAGLQILAALALFFAGLAVQSGSVDAADIEDLSAPVLFLIATSGLVLAAAAIVIAARFRSGRGGVRAGAIAIGTLVAVNGLVNLFTGGGFAGPSIALGCVVLVNCLRKPANDYFNRPRTTTP
ncbi:hypothetical protein [Streptomyces sp. NPDC048659]|uniref:hypothetical protein n=1 Tax=Streptomyces sp. NPDC048659 TaxID=3155489 RepID=UPI003428567B